MKKKYRFFDEGSSITLRIVTLDRHMTDIELDNHIAEIEDETGCYVLWEEIK